MKTQIAITVRQPAVTLEGTQLEAACSFDVDLEYLQPGNQSSEFNQQLQQRFAACLGILRQAQPAAIRSSRHIPQTKKVESQQVAEANSQLVSSPDTAKFTSKTSSTEATQKQLRAFQAIARKIGCEPMEFVRQSFDVTKLDQLTLSQASMVIDKLKSQQAELV